MREVYPSRRFLWGLGGCCLLSILPLFIPYWGTFVAGAANIILILGGVLDYLFTPEISTDTISCEFPEEIGVGSRGTFKISLSYKARNWFGSERPFVLYGQFYLHTDPALDLEQRSWSGELVSGETFSAETMFVPVDRKRLEPGPLKFRYRGLLGILVFPHEKSSPGRMDVVPSVQQRPEQAIRADRIANVHTGSKSNRRKAQEGEFDSLTEYRQGMDPRKIDWKSSARDFRMLARKYRLEQNHHIYIGLDVGRLMGTRSEGVRKLDHAINAALRLSYLALNVGDKVGMLAFEEEMVNFVRARGGIHQFSRLTKNMNELSTVDREPNFIRAFRRFSHLQRRRSLLIVLSDFVDRVSATLCLEALSFLRQRHLALYVACSDLELEEAFYTVPDSLRRVHQQNEMYRMMRARKQVLQEMEGMGVDTIDIEVSWLTIPLLNRYMDIKQAQKL